MSTALKSVHATITIHAPKADVWRIWSTFTNIADYHPDIPKSYGIGTIQSGLGAARRCDIDARTQVDERITAWEEGERYSMQVIHSTGLPIDQLAVDFTVAAQGKTTQAELTIHYRMKGILRFLPTQGMFRKQAENHLLGLKHHVETGETVSKTLIKHLRKQAQQNA